MLDSDVIVIGSGPAGAQAALYLAEQGVRVLVLDGGYDTSFQSEENRHFEEVRRGNTEQWKLFLGEDLSSIPLAGLQGGMGGGMASGNRSYVTRDTDTLLPLTVEGGECIQSLAKGGLGAVWGAACAYFTHDDLRAMGLPPTEMERWYSEVTERIGISGPQTRTDIQPPSSLDHHGQRLLEQARKKASRLRDADMSVMQPHLAILTQDKGNRRACTPDDMQYYTDAGHSVYRPQYTIDDLHQFPDARYEPNILVSSIHEEADGIRVMGHHIAQGKKQTPRAWKARRVICAAGAIGTARILLRSFHLYEQPIPFLAKSHAFTALLHPHTLGKAGSRDRTSLCQLLVLDEQRTKEGLQSACAQLYSYRSFLLFRLLPSIPLPTPEALDLLSVLTPSLIIADVRFPAIPSSHSTIQLQQQEGSDRLSIHLKKDAFVTAQWRRSLRRIHRTLRSLGAYPLRSFELPDGTTSHYAGTIPFSEQESQFPLSTDQRGRLHRTRSIFVADASTFCCLPAKPHTLTIMANARRVAHEVLESL